MQPIQGITQLTTGVGICGNPFVLVYGASCMLSLQVNGSQLIEPISDGPVVSEQGSPLQSYRPAGNNAGASGQLNCLFDNRVAIGGFASAYYWSSTEDNMNVAWEQVFSDYTRQHAIIINI